jgi:Tol biopolymer transport system component/predicted Ser/Thr protein kinase
MMQDDPRLQELAGAIVEGAAIDWASTESSATDESVRKIIRELKVIADIAEVHCSVRLPPEPDATASLAGSFPETLGTWSTLRLLEKVGQGAYGEVYRAWDPRLDREVALKLLPASLADGDARATSIIQEGRLLARVRHPNVVTIYGAERIENRVGLWMEFVKGRTLEQILDQGKVFGASEAIDIGIQLCHAMSAVHSAGLLHRDVKAHNVMVSDDGRVVLMDFGSGGELGNGSSTGVAGTPLYLAPELLRGEDATVRGDIYSVGVTHGGSEHTLLSEPDLAIGPGIDWSPDGEHLVLCARSALGRPWWLLLVSMASAERHWLTAPPAHSGGDSHPVFSPDGSSIAFVRDTGSESGLYVLSLSGGDPRRVMTASSQIRRPAWASDDQSLIFSSYRGAGRNSLWRIAVGGGEPEPVTGTGEGAGDPSTARLHGRLVFLQSLMDQNLYRAELGGDAGAITKLAATTRRDVEPDVSPDGSRIAFVSDRAGDSEIWVMDTSGTTIPLRLVGVKIAPHHPRWSPDGRYLAFAGHVSGVSHSDIHVVDAAGGLTQRLTSEASNEEWPTWSADSRWIYFMSDRNGNREIWKVPAGGGRAEQVTTGGGLKAWESSDGRFLYYSTGTPAPAIRRMSTGGGATTLIFRLPAGTAWGGEWVLTDSGIYWVNGQTLPRAAIEFLSLTTGRVTPAVTPAGVFDEGGGFSVSRDSGWIVFGQRDYDGSDIMMIDGFE